ncbi:MAG: histidine kinase [Pseudomonadota bacterium]
MNLDDKPLPQHLAGSIAGWSARANQYTVFSRTWYLYRMRAYALHLLVLGLILLTIAVLIGDEAEKPGVARSLLAVWVVVALALGLGRGLAMLACRRALAPAREAAAVVGAVLLSIIAILPLTLLTRTGPSPTGVMLVNLSIWFLALCWLGGVLDLFAYFRQRRMLREAGMQQEVQRYKHERNEIETRLAVLASQVEPHFLFNTLSGVRAAIQSDPARGIVLIDHLVNYLRSTIPQLRADQGQAFVTLGSQLDSVAAYLGIIQSRLPRLSYQVDCAPALREQAMPPLMLISLVENAVKHGIELKKGPANIVVHARRTAQNMLELTVKDDGLGFGSVTTGSGLGLSNIRERLAHLYEGQASLTLQGGQPGGVIATIMLPLTLATEVAVPCQAP